MTDDEISKLPRYEILAIDERNYSILKRRTSGLAASREILDTYMPNIGTFDNARFIIKCLKERDDELRMASDERERVFQESLKQPHVFTRATPREVLCYCGKPSGDSIHISDEDRL